MRDLLLQRGNAVRQQPHPINRCVSRFSACAVADFFLSFFFDNGSLLSQSRCAEERGCDAPLSNKAWNGKAGQSSARESNRWQVA
ncbi:hypothetical protein [Accumulibacter sp.]|uniref:hypothetical protein n=1 Tax=Accumulibacter sp. TaxID=2053492 RepID=UPI001A631F71|nr:hypothetical protein [Accumulibacter sp.]MBL8375191.1 hypothetical protein [Accumulibacter sp.]